MTQKLIDRLTARRQRHLRPETQRDRRVHRPELEAFEARQMLSVVYWNTPSDGNWNTVADWTVSGSSPVVHRLPGPTDDVQIETNSDITVTISSGADSVRSLTATDNLVISGGSLTVAANSTVDSLTIGTGGSARVAANAALGIGNQSVIAGTIVAPALATAYFYGNSVVLDPSAVLSGGGNFELVAGSLDINGSVTAPSNFELDGGDLYESGSLTILAGSTFTWRSGTLDGPGQTIVAKAANLDIAGADNKILQGGTVLINNGTATWNDLGNIDIDAGGATIDNYGTWTATTNQSIGGAGMIFNNFGTFAKSIGTGSGVGDTAFNWGNFNNFGTVDGGDLIVDTSGDQDSGTWYAAPNSSISFDGGSQTLNDGTKLTGGGVYEVGYTTLRIDNNFTVANLFLMPNSYLYGNWTLTVTTYLGWLGGTIAGPGAIDIAAGATMGIQNAGTVSLYGTINNAGTILWLGPGQIYGTSGAVINNSGTFEIDSDSTTDGIVVNNSGTLNSVSPSASGTTNFSDTLNNSGTLNLKSGTLLLGSGGSSSNASYNVAAGSVLAFTGGGVEQVSGTFTGSGPGTIEFSSGTTSIAPGGATLDVPGNLFQWTGGVITGAPLTVSGSSTITISGQAYHYLDHGTLDNQGTIVLDGLGALSFGQGYSDSSPGILNNAGTLDFLGDETITNNAPYTEGTINNSGTVLKSAGTGSISFTDVDFNNTATGIVNVESGTLDLWAGLNTGGTYKVAAGSILDLTQGQNATFTGTFTGSGGGIVQVSGGTMTIGSAGATFDFPAGLFQWTGGTLSTPTGATLNLDGTVALVGSSGETLSGGGTVLIGGTVNQTGTGSLSIGGSGNTATTVDIPKGSTYNFAADSGIAQGGAGGGMLDNAGTITKSAGVNTSTISSSFNNLGGTLNVQSGTLTLAPAGGASSGGTFTVASGAALNLTGGQTVNYAGNYTGSGAGQVELTSGALVVVGGSAGATFNFPAGLFQWSGGTIDTNNSTLTISSGKSIALTGFSGESLDGGGALIVSGIVDQPGVGNLTIGGGTTLSIVRGGSYNLQNDSGIAEGAGPGGIVVNAGTLSKTVGTNVSTISTLLNNTGTVAVDTGTLDITGAVSQATGATLEAGTWDVSSTPTVQSTLTFASPPALTAIGVGASVTLSGPHSLFTNLSGLNTNAGSFSVAGGLGFTTAGSLTNSGTITLGASDVLAVAGSYTQTATGTLSDTIAGTAVSGKFGALATTGAASLAGTLAITVPSSFTPTSGDIYPLATYSSHTGMFATITGLNLPGGLSLSPGYNAKNFTLTVGTTASAVSPAITISSAITIAPAIVAQPQPPSSIAPTSNATAPSKSSSSSIKHTGENHPGQARLFRTLSRPATHSLRVPAKRPLEHR